MAACVMISGTFAVQSTNAAAQLLAKIVARRPADGNQVLAVRDVRRSRPTNWVNRR